MQKPDLKIIDDQNFEELKSLFKSERDYHVFKDCMKKCFDDLMSVEKETSSLWSKISEDKMTIVLAIYYAKSFAVMESIFDLSEVIDVAEDLMKKEKPFKLKSLRIQMISQLLIGVEAYKRNEIPEEERVIIDDLVKDFFKD